MSELVYFCVGCGAAIAVGQCCQRCLDSAAAARRDRIAVIYCNFCGKPMKGRMGTECAACETSRLLQEARRPAPKKQSKQHPSGEQPSLW